MTARRIAIIGGGASATLLLAHLSRHARAADMSVDIYDRTGRFGRGVAYSTEHDCHLLNVRAANMSAFHDDKDHFARWAASHGFGAMDFVPRKQYGDYLCEVLADAAKAVPTELIEADVLSCRKDGKTYVLSTTGEATRSYDDVVLASGNVCPLRPKLDGNVDGYFDDPWSADFSALLQAKRIALVGSGLTSVDMVLALTDKGYKGEILVFSRNGLLPAPHVDPVAFAPFLDMAQKHLPLSLLKKVRDQVRASDVPWQSVIDSLRSHTNLVWQGWSDVERQRFMRRILTFWNVHRHRMAPQIAQTVRALQDSGALKIVRAGVRSISAGSSGPALHTAAGEQCVDAVINCLGYRYAEEGRSYDVGHRLGPARFGELFETTAIPEIRAQSYELSQVIMSE